MGRPRNPAVPEIVAVCPEHGRIPHRVHKIGRRPNGEQKYRARCPKCHSAANARTR